MWISSDEIDVSAEEDVFKIIVAWIDYDRNLRKTFLPTCFVTFGLFTYHVTFYDTILSKMSSCKRITAARSWLKMPST